MMYASLKHLRSQPAVTGRAAVVRSDAVSCALALAWRRISDGHFATTEPTPTLRLDRRAASNRAAEDAWLHTNGRGHRCARYRASASAFNKLRRGTAVDGLGCGGRIAAAGVWRQGSPAAARRLRRRRPTCSAAAKRRALTAHIWPRPGSRWQGARDRRRTTIFDRLRSLTRQDILVIDLGRSTHMPLTTSGG